MPTASSATAASRPGTASSVSPVGFRLFTVFAVALIGLGTVALLPHRPAGEPGVKLQLPASVGNWEGRDAEVSQKEREVLGSDVEFARKLYTNTFGDQVFVSIVLAGFDPTTGIHRPERCLPAQGWTINRSTRGSVPMPGGKALDTTQLFSVQERVTDKGQRFVIRNFNYYWFVGAREVTGDSLTRTLIDMKDRLFRGESQRWAYVTVAANVTEGLVKFGRSEEETKKIIEDFIPRVVPQFQLAGVKPAAR